MVEMGGQSLTPSPLPSEGSYGNIHWAELLRHSTLFEEKFPLNTRKRRNTAWLLPYPAKSVSELLIQAIRGPKESKREALAASQTILGLSDFLISDVNALYQPQVKAGEVQLRNVTPKWSSETRRLETIRGLYLQFTPGLVALVIDASMNNDRNPTLLSAVATEAVLSLTALVSTTFSGNSTNLCPQLLNVNAAATLIPVLQAVASWYENDDEMTILREAILNLASDLKQKEKDRFASIEAVKSIRGIEDRDGRGQPSQEVVDLEQCAANISISMLTSVEFAFDAIVGGQWPTVRVPGMIRPPEAHLHTLKGVRASAEACIVAMNEESRVIALRRLCLQMDKASTISIAAGREKPDGFLSGDDECGHIIQALLKCLQGERRILQDLASFTLAQIMVVVSSETTSSEVVAAVMSFLDSIFKHSDGRNQCVNGMVSTLCELVATHAVRSRAKVLQKALNQLFYTNTRPLGLEILRHLVNNHLVGLSKDRSSSSSSSSGSGNVRSSGTMLPNLHMLTIVEKLCCLLEEPNYRSKSITEVLKQAVWTVDPLWAAQKLCASMRRSESPYELQYVLSALVCGLDDDAESKAMWFCYDCHTSVNVLCAVVDCLQIGGNTDNCMELNAESDPNGYEYEAIPTSTSSEHGNSGPNWVRRIINCIPEWSKKLSERGSLGLVLCSLAKKVFARPDECISIRIFSNLAKGVTKCPMEGVATAQAAEAEMAQQSELNKHLLDCGSSDMLRNLLFARLSPLLVLKALPRGVFVAIETVGSSTLFELEDSEIDAENCEEEVGESFNGYIKSQKKKQGSLALSLVERLEKRLYGVREFDQISKLSAEVLGMQPPSLTIPRLLAFLDSYVSSSSTTPHNDNKPTFLFETISSAALATRSTVALGHTIAVYGVAVESFLPSICWSVLNSLSHPGLSTNMEVVQRACIECLAVTVRVAVLSGQIANSSQGAHDSSQQLIVEIGPGDDRTDIKQGTPKLSSVIDLVADVCMRNTPIPTWCLVYEDIKAPTVTMQLRVRLINVLISAAAQLPKESVLALSAWRKRESLLDSAAKAAMVEYSTVDTMSTMWIASCLQCIFILIFKSTSTSGSQNPQILWHAAKLNLYRYACENGNKADDCIKLASLKVIMALVATQSVSMEEGHGIVGKLKMLESSGNHSEEVRTLANQALSAVKLLA